MHSFKRAVEQEGVLHFSFQSTDSFVQQLRMHLARHLQAILKRGDSASLPHQRSLSEHPRDSDSVGSEDGFVDLLQLSEDRFKTVVAILLRVTAELTELEERMLSRTKEANDAVARATRPILPSEAKLILDRGADDLNNFAAKVVVDLPAFQKALSEGIHAVGRAATLSVGLESSDLSRLRSDRDALAGFDTVLVETRASVVRFRSSIEAIPRLTTVLDTAKRNAIGVLDEFLLGVDGGRQDAEKVVAALDQLLAGSSRTEDG